MRVLAMLHLYTPWHNAGAELMAHALLRALVDRGHDVDVLLSQDHPEIVGPYVHDGVRVHPRRGKGDPMQWLADPDRKPHLLVTHLENTDRASILGAHYQVPVVQLLHNTHSGTKHELLRMPALAVANTVWMAEDVVAWWLWERGERPMPRMMVVHPPVAVADYETKPGDHITLINLYADKGAETFYALAKRFPHKKFLGVVGAYGEQIRMDLPNVELIDHVRGDRMREQVYSRTKVLLVPSAYESYGRVSIEAACSGIPVIAHPTAGLMEALGDAGSFADRDDTDAWEQHLKRLLSPRGWSAASKKARERATQLDPSRELEQWAQMAEVVGGSARVLV